MEFADTAARLVRRGRAAYDADEMLRLAAESIVHKVGEAVSRLPDDFVAAHPTVSWRVMKGMRNRVADEYRAIDYAIVWGTLERDLPKDAAAVRAILAEMGG
ncbi:HepT-like ribonuclease domain-containing protein [Nocardioides flavescens]|uniref:DUF86 domain-containing protein n=1 Tax=Nocardioides flavescens TaxID=2691959 RepID=A0A6L7EUJ0_9ACTN|nr:HepT-like ribonuclease domain-containing protein [Nocardioides flavescens]MXG91013.1 DUF86 domain-containing protein [Nocardioides flavescens]